MALAYVNRGAPNGATSGSATSAVTTAISTTTGNLLVLTVWRSNASGAISVSDTAGNTWYSTLEDARMFNTNSNRVDIWYAYNITGNASNVVTATFSSCIYAAAVVYEFSGFGDYDPIGSLKSDALLTAGTAVSTGSMDFTGNSESVFFGAMICAAGGQTAGTGYSLTRFAVSGDAVEYFANEYKIVTASEAVTATCTSSNWSITGVEFKAPVTATPRVKLLVVGGGGSGGYTDSGNSYAGGGGGGGEAFYDSTFPVSAQAYTVTVGAGGTGTSSAVDSGDSSVFDSITALGGGYGGIGTLSAGNAANGGSGGGSTDAGTRGTGDRGQRGGDSRIDTGASGSGGGIGMYGNSDNAGSPDGAFAGQGRAFYISGSKVFYGGGGGGGGYQAAGAGGVGGSGGGGAGGVGGAPGGNKVPGTAGTANTGGGGGGSGSNVSGNAAAGGNGGSGIVVVAYKTDGSDGVSDSSTGGTITTSGSYTIHTFTTSGTFTCVLAGGGGVVKTVEGKAVADIKTIEGEVVADVKTYEGAAYQ